MKKYLVLLLFLFISATASAELQFKSSLQGDYHLYYPKVKAINILVVAHGMFNKNEEARDVSKRYIERWRALADEKGLIVIAPVFDDRRFGMFSQGYGGYRNLFGRYQAADKFVNELVDTYSKDTSSKSSKFYLYGHSAGGQFTNRYTVTHPQRIIKAVVSAAGRYSYPDKSAKWPYGAGDLSKTISWKKTLVKNKVFVTKRLLNYALAASKISVVIGALDTKKQPKRPAHRGNDRIEIAKSWAKSMNRNAKLHGLNGNVIVHIIDGIAHDSKRLTPYSAEVLFAVTEETRE